MNQRGKVLTHARYQAGEETYVKKCLLYAILKVYFTGMMRQKLGFLCILAHMLYLDT